MKLNGDITILCDGEYVDIEIRDETSRCMIVKTRLSPSKFTAALSRLCNVDCEIEVGDLPKVGKTMENKRFSFPMPDCDYKSQTDVARKESKKHVPDGWKADNYYCSQDSFFTKDGVKYAMTVIRRWV